MTRKFILDNGIFIVLVLCLVAVYPALIYRHENNAPVIAAFTYLGPISVFLMIYLYCYSLPELKTLKEKISLLFRMFLTTVFCVFLFGGPISLINAKLGMQSQVCIAGAVVDKWMNNAKNGAKYYNLRVQLNEQKKVDLDVTSLTFNRLKTGQTYEECWTKGSLGLLYKED